MKQTKFFRFTAKYTTESTKRVKEDYLVEASCYTEAEANATSELEGRKDLTISNIRPVAYLDIIDGGGSIYYEVQADFILVDERNGNEKRASQKVLIIAENVSAAVAAYHEYMRGTLSDYELVAVKKTKFIDVFIH